MLPAEPLPPRSLCPAEPLQLQWRPFRLELSAPLRNARGLIRVKAGWLLRLQAADGRCGWGEAAPLDGELGPLAAAIERLGPSCPAPPLEAALPALPPALAFALGAALAELQGLPQRRWLAPPPSAWLLPAGEAMLPALAALQQRLAGLADPSLPAALPVTVKWKVAAAPDALERPLLEQLLQRLPEAWRLRLDANGGWTLATAAAWAERLQGEPRLQWLEQPLDPHDAAGLAQLQERFPQLPLALDEALQRQPALRQRWSGWQVRRPAQEGDPRPLLRALEQGTPHLMLSTGFETGIGRRWLEHLAALQALGPTPVAPGLAPGWQPAGDLSSLDPERVWQAAA